MKLQALYGEEKPLTLSELVKLVEIADTTQHEDVRRAAIAVIRRSLFPPCVAVEDAA